ncbi:response regulator [candidate division KSB1 bacterium]|nr:response regulator [candidate division KSB1 bacterium]
MNDKARIMVVEDEFIVSMEIQDRLKGLGYSIAYAAASGEEAIVKAGETQPDLVLMDIMLKGKIDGVFAAEQIKNRYDIPVIYLTAHSDEATLTRAKVSEPFGYLIKPFDERALHTTIEMAFYRHDMERKLKQSEQWLSIVLNSIGDAVIATDTEGMIKFINPLAESLTGWKHDEALNQKINQIFNIRDDDNKIKIKEPIKKVLKKGIVNNFSPNTVLTTRYGNELPIDSSASPIRDEKGNINGAVLVFRNITDKKKLERQLTQAQKMESIGLMAGGVAHDFNNILAAILGYASFMKIKLDIEDPNYKYVETIERSAQRGAELTSQLLTFTRGGKQDIKPINLNDIVNETVKIIKSTFDKAIEIETRLFNGLTAVRADEVQMQQLLMNLCVNARDAMPFGGKLIVETDMTFIYDHDTSFYVGVKSGSYVTVSVSDTGVGMDKDTLGKIFDPFFTTKEKGKGTGLGLSMVYGVIKNHGGFEKVTSEPNKGTTFKIYFPACDKFKKGAKSVTKKPQQGNEVILVVDDEEPIRMFVKDVLEAYGYTVFLAENGEEAVSIFKKYKDKIDLVILDMVMPKMGGLQTYIKLKMLNPKIRAFLSSGYSPDGQASEILQRGVNGFLQKPFEMNDLLIKVRDVLDMKIESPKEDKKETKPLK